MGGIRTKIEPSRIVIAIKCDKDAHIVSQGTAPIVVTSGESAKIILQEDLLSTGKDNDVMSFAGEMLAELRRVRRDAGVLGRVVDPDDRNAKR